MVDWGKFSFDRRLNFMATELPANFQRVLDSLTDEELAARGITREQQRKRMERRVLRDHEKSPSVGDEVPSLALEILTPDGMLRGEYLDISALRGKPVGILFGSYSCPFFRNAIPPFIDVANAHGDRIQFLCIYLDEAHASNGIQLTVNRTEGIDHKQPRSEDERATIAADCIERFKFPFPVLLDTMDDNAKEYFIASPVRLYMLNEEGRIAYKGGLGPHYLDVEEFAIAVSAAL
jgi:hypothetical protein